MNGNCQTEIMEHSRVIEGSEDSPSHFLVDSLGDSGIILLGDIIRWRIDMIINSISKPALDEYNIEPILKSETKLRSHE